MVMKVIYAAFLYGFLYGLWKDVIKPLWARRKQRKKEPAPGRSYSLLQNRKYKE